MNTSEKSLPAAVSFHDREIITIRKDGVEYVALKSIAEGMGLDWESQYKLTQRDLILKSTISIMEIVAQDGKKREMVCLPLKFLNGWLFKINAARYKNKIQQERIIQYQLECYDALYNYWHKGSAYRTRPAPNRDSLEYWIECGNKIGVEFLAEELLDYKKDSDRWFKAWDEVGTMLMKALTALEKATRR